MVDISRKTFKRNGVEIIVDSDGKLWFLEKHIKGGLYHKSLRVTTVKCLSGYRKHRYELTDEPKKQPNRIFSGT